jgi:hypothetical protein
MYSTCIFCHSKLGQNEAIEHFPVGRRLAFDAERGRLWVVCRRCERWNLSPLEERWEAIEESERAFSETKLRVSTEHIGLARLKEGLELIRIGEPKRPEMAAWRYGDQFGRRRRRQVAYGVGAAVLVGGIVIGGPMLGLVGGGAFNGLFNLLNAGQSIYRSRKLINVPHPGAETPKIRAIDLPKVKLRTDGNDIELEVPVLKPDLAWYRYERRNMDHLTLHGEDAVRAAGALLPHLNQSGGSAKEVQRAVHQLEQTSGPLELFREAARSIEESQRGKVFRAHGIHALRALPTEGRLALEMATQEESERRALEGELHILDAAWREAEEIAAIADDLLLPSSIPDKLAELHKKNP